MSNTTIVSILARCNTLFVDTSKTRWPYEELLTWFNDAVLEIVNLRPDSKMKNAPYTLTANSSIQTLPSEGLRWHDVVFDILTGEPIFLTDKKILDNQIPAWHRKTGTRPTCFVFDERDPKTMYIYPQVTTPRDVQVMYSIAPVAVIITDFDTDTTVLPIDDIYVNAIMNFILHLGYSKDVDYAQSNDLSQRYHQMFLASLNAKNQVDGSFSPKSTGKPNA